MAVVVSLMMMLALGALCSALAVLSVGETRIVASFRAGTEALHAADAGIEIALNHLSLLPDWKAAAAGGAASPLIKGPLRSLSQVPGIESDMYVVVWLAEHPVDRGPDMAVLRAHAYGPHGVRRTIEVDVARTAISTVRITSWHEVR